MATSRSKRAKTNAGEGAKGGKKPKWKDAVAEQPDEAFAPYAMSSTFTEGDFVDHAKFGKGVVLIAEGGKISVLFQEGIKRLLHAMP